MMTRRIKFGVVAAALVGLAGLGLFQVAQASFSHGGRQAIMQRFVSSAIDDVLEEAKVTPQQHATINAARDRVFTAFANTRTSHKGQIEDALRLFEADQVEPSRLEILRTQREDQMKQLADVVQQAVVEAHDTLNPQQRHLVAERIRSLRAHHE